MRLRDLAVFAACGGGFLLAAGCGGGQKNQPPALSTTSLAATEDTTLSAQLAATDPEGKTITFALGSGAQHGQATVAASGAVIYTPTANYAGADTFTVRVTDQKGLSSTGTVSVTVANVNDAPAITTTTLNATEDTVLAAQIVATDPDNNPLAFTLVTNAQHGLVSIPNGGPVSIANSGAVSYTPDSNYFGTDSFTVRVSDGAGGEATGTVNITVAAVNDAPVLTGPIQLSVAEDGTLAAHFTAGDIENDPVQFAIDTGAAHGQATLDPNGQLGYEPVANYFGDDQIVVRLSDGSATSRATVALTVTPVNDPPVANDDEVTLTAGASVTVPLVGNDIDVDGDILQVSILTQPGGGTLSVDGPDTVTFTRDNAFNGPIQFTYRVTDAAGLTSDATVRAVIGDFPGIYFLSDETTVGKAELHFFDGLQVSRISAALPAGASVTSFAVSGDGSRVGYVVTAADFDRVYLTTAQSPAPALVYSSPMKADPSSAISGLELNRDGSYLRLYDPDVSLRDAHILRVADGLLTSIGSGDPQIIQGGSYFAFSPTNDDFYAQLQFGGSATMSGTGYLTLFRGAAASPGGVTQVGTTYPAPSQGAGSAMELQVSSDGRYVVHREILFSPVRSSVLVYDSVTNSEAPVYRRPVAGEIGMWDGFALSNDGKRVCFQFREPGGGSFGPSRFIVGDPAAPASAAPVTPVTTGGYKCYFGSDNHTLFYIAQTAAAPTLQMYSVDSASPGTPALVNRALVSGESMDNWWVARNAMRLVFGTRMNAQTDFYSVSLDDPGTFIIFATNVFDDGSMPGQLDDHAHMLAYSKRPAPLSGLRRLTLLSTQSPGYSRSLTRADSTTGMLQFRWAR
jgi:VCBS repeat-containing protein